LVVSGTSAVIINPDFDPVVLALPNGGEYSGTLVVTAFRQQEINDFAALLHDAKIRAGLLSRHNIAATFTS
jgi:hypothetical protein